jgi:hypothetical protein
MVRRTGRKSIDRARFRQFQRVAGHFREAAEASIELEYWTAAGVLIVHSAIAFADALCIKLSGQKSAGENHEDAVALVDEVVARNDEKQKAVGQLRRIIEEKTKVSYLGELYGPKEVKEMWKRLERFADWAEGILNR